MRNTSEKILIRNSVVLGRRARITRLTSALGGILFLAQLHNPNQALGAIPLGAESATLAWDRSSSPGVAGYRVYFGATSGNYTSSIVAGNATTNTVPGLMSGVAYYFAVKAYGTNGLESTFSNEIRFVPGLPTIQIHVTANGQAVLTLKGPVGRTYDIQAATNFAAWIVLGTVTIDAGGSAGFTDTNTASFPKRFYRSRQNP